MSDAPEPNAVAIQPPSWKAIIALLGWLTPFIVSAGMLYLGKEFATHTEVRAAVLPFEELPKQVSSLQEFRARQERSQERSEQKFEVVQQTLATISAQQKSTDDKLNRVLDYIDRQAK